MIEKAGNDEYLVVDDKGMILEQGKAFQDNIIGDINDVINKSRKIFDDEEISINIQFEKANLVIVNNKDKKLSVCSLSTKS